jgi:hypothetical protein
MTAIMNSTYGSALLLALGCGACAMPGQQARSSEAVLTYSRSQSLASKAVLVKSALGASYRLSLVPDFDVSDDVVVLQLVLARTDGIAEERNLLDATGRLHGYQPYYFAASDFARGAKNSMYGDSRHIDVPQLGIMIQAKVAVVHVKPTSGGIAQTAGYEFDDLTLEITTQRRPGGTSKEAAR